MEEAISNYNGKIWIFIDSEIQWEILMNTDQQITLKVHYPNLGTSIISTFVYATCDAGERSELWDNLYHLASAMVLPWMVGGDCNVILSDEEKLGGLPVTLNECEDFAFYINSYELFDTGSPYLNFMLKLKKLKMVLSQWSKETFGDIFQQLAIREEIVKVKEALFEEDPSVVNSVVLQKAQAEMKQYLNLEEQYWKQKAQFSWYTEGDRNTAFFHNYVTGKRRNLLIKGIHDGCRLWVDSMKQISQEAIKFFQKQFT
ncbi:uncharacterized protein LOC132061469 [Lycium ferocissimum]|uniref:uncharacterized protein LOC132061469 n=1 Tax=Lycium ferocissimum TaxID=112874 RepID=UPI0028164F57|nr:uncharacterized protein LOC132061469 [Lycium ferocissimum]